jgi:hypothetical protein
MLISPPRLLAWLRLSAGSFAAAYYVYETRKVPGSNATVYPW